MMEQISWRHHYVPQFYLKNFANSQGKFHIYLIDESRFKDQGKLFSTKSHFFEKDGNTLKLGGEPTDFLESTFYKWLDTDISKIFNKIKKSKEPRYGISEKDMPAVQFFVAHLFWRNPINYDKVKYLLDTHGLSDLGIKIVDRNSNISSEKSEFERRLTENGTIQKLVKQWLPAFFFDELIQSGIPLTILKFDVGRKPSIVGDNPVIFRNPDKFNVYTDDFILPLTNDKILIRTRDLNPECSNSIIINIDYLILRQSKSFVATTDLEYIPMLEEKMPRAKVEQIRFEIFNELTRKSASNIGCS